MNSKTVHKDVLVKVEMRSPHKTLIIALNEKFQDKVVIDLDVWKNHGEKEVKVTFEDESYTWVTCPQDAFIYRTYTQIAEDGPAETK